MKSASYSTISALVFHGGEIFVISLRVYQVQNASHLGTGVLRRMVAGRHWQMPGISLLFLFSHHLCFLLHLNITFSCIFPPFEHYFCFLRALLLSIWIRCSYIHKSGLALPPKESYIGKIACSQAHCAIFIAVSNLASGL